MYLGFAQDIEAARIFSIYKDPVDACNVLVLTYPGQTVAFDPKSYLNPSKPNCIDLDAQYGTLWPSTMKAALGRSVIKYQEKDPFGIFGSVISMTTQLYVENSDGTKTINGLIGMHYNTTLFERAIDPLIENESLEYHDTFIYWVFSIKQTI